MTSWTTHKQINQQVQQFIFIGSDQDQVFQKNLSINKMEQYLCQIVENQFSILSIQESDSAQTLVRSTENSKDRLDEVESHRSGSSSCIRQEQLILSQLKSTPNYYRRNNFEIKRHKATRRVTNQNPTFTSSHKTKIWMFHSLSLLLMMLMMHSKAANCFNDKLPSFIMNTATLFFGTQNEYVWQTVIKSQNDKFLYKGGYVKITSATQTSFPGAPIGTQAIAGLFDIKNNNFIWVKALVDENISSPMISAIALNYNEDTLVLAGTSTNAKKSFYFFVDPMTGDFRYPSFSIQHEQDFHFLTSQSILIAGASRIYCAGISMHFTYVAGTSQFTLECTNIGQTCSGTDNSITKDAIQYLVVDYATQTVLWHKIAHTSAHFGAGSVASLIDVNPTAIINGNEHVLMGGGFSLYSAGVLTAWKASLMSINPTTGQLDLVKSIQPIAGGVYYAVPTATNYPVIVHMYLHQTATQWSIFTLTQSRLLSTTGAATYNRHLCQIDFSSAQYTTVSSINCKDASNPATQQKKTYGTGIKYDPIAVQVHYINHNSNLATNTASNHLYGKLNIVTGAIPQINNFYNTFISNAGVFTNQPLITLTNGFQVFPGYFVGYEKSFSLTQFPTSPAALTFTKNAAVIYPYDRAETCSVETLPASTTGSFSTLTATLSTQSNLLVGQQSNQVVVQRLYKTIDLQFKSLVIDNLCGTSSYTPLTVIPSSFHNVNLYIGSTTQYQCPFIGNTLSVACTDLNEQIYSIDESSIIGSKANIFTADGLNSKILMKILDPTVLSQSQTVKVTSTTPSGQSGTFIFCTNLIAGSPPVGYDPCSIKTCLNDVDPILILKSAIPSNITYDLGSAINNIATILPFNLTASCTYCTQSDIVYSMIVTPVTSGQSSSFIVFNSVTGVIDWTTSNPLNGGEFEITIQGAINRATVVQDTLTFKVIILTQCNQTSGVLLLTPSVLLDQTYTWLAAAGSQAVTPFTLTYTSTLCSASDIIYTMSVTGSVGGSSTFLSFNSVSMLVNWYYATNRIAETFTIVLTATISNLNTASPFLASSSFLLIVTAAQSCPLSLDVPTITTPILVNQVYILTQAAGSYTIPASNVSSTLLICTANDIAYTMSVTSLPTNVTNTSWITFNSFSRTVSWEQSLINFLGNYTINIIGSITNQLGTYVKVTSFLLNVVQYNPLAVCIETPTKIISKQVEHLFAFIGYQTRGNIDYSTFTDTVSESLGVKSYCGDINLTLTYDSSSIGLTLDQGFLNFVAPNNPTQFGDYPSKLTVSLDNIGIKLDLSLDLTALTFVPPVIQNIIYHKGGVKFQTQLGQFQLLPQNYTLNGSPLIAYVLDPGSQLQSPVNTSSLTMIPSWVSLNGSLFTVETNLDSSVGEYQIVILQNFVGVEGYAFVNFKLTVLSTSVPIFDNDLNEVYYTNCSNQINLPTFNDKLKMEFNCPDQKFIEASGIFVNIGSKFCKNGTYLCTIVLTNENNISKPYQLKIIVGNDTNKPAIKSDLSFAVQEQQISKLRNYFPHIQKNKFIWQSPDFDPIKIVSISHSGLVTFRFNQKVLVPQFGQINETGNQLTDYINQTHISLKRIDMNDDKIIQLSNWTTKSLTETEMEIQIYFDKPLDVSNMTPDLLNATFLDNQLFILQDGQRFLFNQQNITVYRNFRIPTQFASEEQAKKAKQLTDAITYSSPSVIIVSLVIQIFAKQLISQVWIFFCALQLIIYINKNVNTSLPASAMITFECLDGILTLNAINKNAIVDFLGLQKIKDSEFFQSLGVLALLVIIIVLMVALVVIFYKFCKGKPKQICLKLKDMLFWNFLIRYFYAAFINFTSASLTTLTNSNAGTTELVASSLILSIQVGIICLFIYALMQGHPINLQTPTTKKKFGFLYNQLDSIIPQKRFYFLMFFAERVPIICLLVSKTSYGLQQALIQIILLAHTIYLLHFQPYENQEDLVQDLMNEIFLMTIHALQLSISPWQKDGTLTNDLGQSVMYFIAFFFAINFGIIVSKIIQEQLRKKMLKRVRKNMHKQMNKKIAKNRLDQIQKLKLKAIKSEKVQHSLIDDLTDFRPRIEDIDFNKIHSSQKLFKEIRKMKAIRTKLIKAETKPIVQKSVKTKFPKQHEPQDPKIFGLPSPKNIIAQKKPKIQVSRIYTDDDQSLFNVSALNFSSELRTNNQDKTTIKQRIAQGRSIEQTKDTVSKQKDINVTKPYNLKNELNETRLKYNRKIEQPILTVDDQFNIEEKLKQKYPYWLFN